MSSAGYKPLNDTDTEEELKNVQGKAISIILKGSKRKSPVYFA